MMFISKYLLVTMTVLCPLSVCQAQSPLAQSSWISSPSPDDPAMHPAQVFVKNLHLQKSIKNAVLFITSTGIYKAEINNKKAGTGFFTPGFTSYSKRLQYQKYEVTKLLKTGANGIKITVADGWYRGAYRSDSRFNDPRILGVLVELNIMFNDGTTQNIVSDSRWQSGTEAVQYADIYNGETRDTRVKQILNSAPVKLIDPKVQLVPTIGEPVRAHERFSPERVFTSPKDEQIIDFGQNLAGWVELKLKGKSGDTIKIYHAEMLDSAGNFWSGNLRSAKALDTYILDGTEQTLHPEFTYHGFRYIKVEGFKPNKTNVTAVALYTDLKPSGTFSCSDPMLNKLQNNIYWSMKSNFVDIPTDCPQRSERMGWTGDAQVFCKTAAFNADVSEFYRKWLLDLAADQDNEGAVPSTIPDVSEWEGKANKPGFSGWADAATIVPWTMYEQYGDTNILKQQYSSMKAWIDYVQMYAKDNLWTGQTFGDWYAPGPSVGDKYIDQCFYAHSIQLLINAAKVLDKRQDVVTYTRLLTDVKNAFINAFGKFDTPETQAQTAYVLALAFDLVPEDQRQSTAAKLAKVIESNNDHLTTGFLGTPYLLPVLSAYGYIDLAYRLLNQKTCPSWLYPITKGATTIWEKWDAIKPDGTIQETSFNHYAYGAVGTWLYENVGGIRAAAPGYKKILIKPEIGGGLTWVKSSYKCRYGLIRSEWKLDKKNRVIMDIEIPKGTSATVYVPGGKTMEVGPGTYRIIGKANTTKVRPDKIFVVSDIEGELDLFKDLLVSNRIIDKKDNWIFGKGDLVIAGDLFDRGKQVFEVLELLHSLEQKAILAGGEVHVILGNHDILNLSGDFKYVDQKYLNGSAEDMIAYKKLFDENSVLGKWLRSKPMIEKVGDMLFLHAGISPEVLATGKSIEEINAICRPFYGAAKSDIPDSLKIFFGREGPFWYRGYFMSPRTSSGFIDSTLNHFGCKQILVGHTILERNPAMYFGGKVIGIDVDYHLGKSAGLLFENGKCRVCDGSGVKRELVYKPENDIVSDKDIL